ncbi:MAG: BamA/TamA family outer membrane protein [bacterium]
MISSITISGCLDVPSAELIDFLPFKTGDSFKPDSVKLAGEILTSFYNSLGYMDASVSSEVETGEGTAAVFLTAMEGPRYFFGEITMEGLSSLRQEFLRKDIAFKRGEPYDSRKILETQGHLYGLGFFEDITIRVSTTPAGTADVTVILKEKPMKWIKGGAGYGSEEKERFSLILTHNNFLRRAYKLELYNTLSRIWLEYKAEFMNRHFLGSATEYRNVVSWRKENRKGYDLENTKGIFSLGRKIALHSSGSVQYRMQRSVTYNVNPAIAETTPSESQIRALALTINRDTSDDPFFPARGSRSEMLLERSGGLIGGDVHFYRISANAAAYHRFHGRVIGAVSAKAGMVRETHPSAEVPVFERYFAGGGNSVRGYAERDVGPKDSVGAPLGGNLLLSASSELRFPLLGRLNGAVFVDAGQVGGHARMVLPSEWKYGAGGGLRYRTPVGPFRLDLGYKLNPDTGVSDFWHLHLSLGEAF